MKDIGDLTEEQQVELFSFIYPDYISWAVSNYKTWTVGIESAKDWDELDEPIQEVLGDVMNIPYDNWVPEAFGAISQAAEQGADYQYSLVPQFYRDLMAELDSNQDGKVTAEEIRQAMAVRDPLVKDVVNRLVVKHHSDWCGGRSTGRWEGFYKELDSLEVKYCEKWQADLEWMSQLPPFDKDEAVWHFHPVVFLDILSSSNLITLEMVLAANLNENKSQCERLLPYLNKYAKAYKREDKKEIAHFLSQIGHESGFNITEENLNYSAKGMRRIFGCIKVPSQYNKNTDNCNLGRLRDKLWTQESSYAHKPESLANYFMPVEWVTMGNLRGMVINTEVEG